VNGEIMKTMIDDLKDSQNLSTSWVIL